METNIMQAVAQHTEEILGKEGFRYASIVVANCKMLALEMEASGEEELQTLDMDALILAGYLHDISTVAYGFPDHQFKSAEMASQFLRELAVPAERILKVEQAILGHLTVITPEQRKAISLEARILYDADKIGRLSGLAVVTALIEFGARYPNRAVNSDVLTIILRHIEERFVELYQSLNTAPARAVAQKKFGNTLAFL